VKFGKQVNDGLGNAFPEMDDVKPTEEFGKWRFPKWMTSNPLKREEPGNEVWEMAFPEMDNVRERRGDEREQLERDDHQ